MDYRALNEQYREDWLAFAKRLSKYDVVSFDVFDTLVLRNTSGATAIYAILGEEFGVYDFVSLRKTSEDIARDDNKKRYGHQEATIREIYDIINQKLCPSTKLDWHRELELDTRYSIANPYMKKVVDYLASKGVILIATSDIYYENDEILALLTKCGYTGFKEVFSSSSCKTSKKSGGIFEIIKERYQNLNIVHVGDNVERDVKTARTHKLDAYEYKNSNDIGKLVNPSEMSILTGKLYSGIINNRLLNGIVDYSPQYQFGFSTGGLYVLGMANWIKNKCKEKNIEKVIFLSRDGFIYSKVYDKLKDHTDWEYFHWSRFAGMKMLAYTNFYDFCQRVIHHKAKPSYNVTIHRLLERLDLIALEKDLPKYSLQPNDILTKDNKDSLERCFIDNHDYILSSFSDFIKVSAEEIKKAIGEARSIAIVDVGWAGFGPLILKSIINSKIDSFIKVSCLLAGSRNRLPIIQASYLLKDDIDVYLFSETLNKSNHDAHVNTNNGMNTLLFEMLTQSAEASIVQYGKEGPEYSSPDTENYQSIKEIECGILDFVDTYLENFGDKDYLLNISGYDAYLPFKELSKNIGFFKNVFGEYIVSNRIFDENNIRTLKDFLEDVGL